MFVFQHILSYLKLNANYIYFLNSLDSCLDGLKNSIKN